MFTADKYKDSLHANELGLLAKGMMSFDSLDEFVNAAPNHLHYRHLADEIKKSVYSTDSYEGLVDFNSRAISFLDTLHRSLVDGIKSYRIAPILTRVFVGDAFITGTIAHGGLIPVSGRAEQFSLTYQKTGGISVFTKEQIADGSGNAESFITKTLRETVTGCTNKSFIDSVLLTDSNTLTVPSLGETAANIVATLGAALAALALKPTSSLYLVTDLATCASVATATDTNGNLAFPGVHCVMGGEIVPGVQLFPVGEDQLPDADSDGRFCVLFDADGILIDRGSVYLSRSDSGSIELSNAPDETNPVVSLFQTDAVALRILRTFAVKQIRNCAVRITGVEW